MEARSGGGFSLRLGTGRDRKGPPGAGEKTESSVKRPEPGSREMLRRPAPRLAVRQYGSQKQTIGGIGGFLNEPIAQSGQKSPELPFFPGGDFQSDQDPSEIAALHTVME